eukprot:6157764-Amphidinium_carterae.1
MREFTKLEDERESLDDNEREKRPLSQADRETMFEYNEEREIGNEYNEIVEIEETMDDDEYNQTMRFCSDTDEMTVHMVKMNIKLPNPTQFDGKSP